MIWINFCRVYMVLEELVKFDIMMKVFKVLFVKLWIYLLVKFLDWVRISLRIGCMMFDICR